MADAGIDLHMLQRVAGHKDPAVTAGYLHPDTQAVLAAGDAFSDWWSHTEPCLGCLTGARGGGSRRVSQAVARSSSPPSRAR
jgi:hypothetical protein